MEEELRKEQTEMHKLLKAKQDLIDIQKKRIEHLTNRNGPSATNSQSTKSINTILNQKNSIFQQQNSANIGSNANGLTLDSPKFATDSESQQKWEPKFNIQ